MKFNFNLLSLISLVWLFPSAHAEPTLVVYGYDSLVAKNSWGEQVAHSFERQMKAAKTPVKVKLVSVGEGAQILNRLSLDQKRGKNIAHIAWGIDPGTFEKLKSSVEPYVLANDFPWEEALKSSKAPAGFVPFDFGIYAFIQDTSLLPLAEAPTDWLDLILPKFKKKILLEDPRTSIPGLAWVLGSEDALGKNEVLLFWKNLQKNWLTLSPSWSQAYALFSKKQAPLVWSYLTSQAYHEENGDSKKRYRAILFSSGQPLQVEGVAIINSAADFEKLKPFAHTFVAHILSLESQKSLAQKQWMMPVRRDVTLPASFLNLPKVKNLRPVFDHLRDEDRSATLRRWSDAIQP